MSGHLSTASGKLRAEIVQGDASRMSFGWRSEELLQHNNAVVVCKRSDGNGKRKADS